MANALAHVWLLASPEKTAMAIQPPKVTITDVALPVIRDTQRQAEPDDVLRLTISAAFESDLFFDRRQPDDIVVDANGITLVMDPRTATRANGLSIDYIESVAGAGFKLDNPNKTTPIDGIRPADVRRMLKKREKFVLVDVRSASERALATVEAAHLLDAAYEAELDAMPKKTKLIFMSHHSNRARSAAQRFRERGFSDVRYVVGGIDAWSTMDPSVPRYGRVEAE